MSVPQEIEARYAPGEDVGPLLRAVGSGLLGVALALVVDRLVPSAAPGGLSWPAVFAAAVFGDPARTAAGFGAGLILAVLAAVVFTYGQFRRFVPGPPVVAGLAWGAALWLVAGAACLPQAARWLGAGAPAAAGEPLLPAIGLLLETAIGMAVYGAALGHLNPSERE